MAEYLPPTENVAIFDTLNFNDGNSPLTYNKAVKYFLRYPSAQGTETLQVVNVNGLLTASAGIATDSIQGIALNNIMNIGTEASRTGAINIGTGNSTQHHVTIGNTAASSITTILGRTITIGNTSGSGMGLTVTAGSNITIHGGQTSGIVYIGVDSNNNNARTGAINIGTSNVAGNTGAINIGTGALSVVPITIGADTSTSTMKGTCYIGSQSTANTNVYINSGNSNSATFINNSASNGGYVYIANGGGANNLRIGSSATSTLTYGGWTHDGSYALNVGASNAFPTNINTGASNAAGGVVNILTGASNTQNCNILTGSTQTGSFNACTAQGAVNLGNDAYQTTIKGATVALGTSASAIALNTPLQPIYAGNTPTTKGAGYIGYQSTATSATNPGATVTNLITQSLNSGVWLCEGSCVVSTTTPITTYSFSFSISTTTATADTTRQFSSGIYTSAITTTPFNISSVVVLSATANVYFVGNISGTGTITGTTTNTLRFTRLA